MEWLTADQKRVVAPRGVEERLRMMPGIGDLLAEALAAIDTVHSKLQGFELELEMGRIIGQAGCIETPEISLDAETDFAYRPRCGNPSRVTPVSTGPDTSLLTVLTTPAREGDHLILLAAYYGPKAPPEPTDARITTDEARQASEAFWCRHALIHHTGMTGIFRSNWQRVIQKSVPRSYSSRESLLRR